jgi:hypothetical protein
MAEQGQCWRQLPLLVDDSPGYRIWDAPSCLSFSVAPVVRYENIYGQRSLQTGTNTINAEGELC